MEFENLQIEVPINDESSPMFAAKIFEKKYKNKKDFVVGFNPNDKEFLERKKRRAKRFGVGKEPLIVDNETITNEGEVEQEQPANEEKTKASFTQLDENFFKTVNLKDVKWPPVLDCALDEMRLDAIHVYGVDHMSTNDIFTYFDLFGPDTLEWIDDYSCNVVWEDEATVSKVMDNMSKTYNMMKELQKKDNTELKAEELSVTVKVEDIIDVDATEQNMTEDEDDIDPKEIWRFGYPFNDNQLFLRPATINDKKMPGAASRSQYYLKYGKDEKKKKVPGIVSKSRKRKLEEMKKRANEIYKLKEPDVKIVALDELAEEGVVSTNMDVEGDEEEPLVKRMNFLDEDHPSKSRTMIADRLEIAHRLGKRYDDGFSNSETSIRNRLGYPDDDSHDDPNRMNDLRNRLESNKSNVHDRLGKRDRENTDIREDARGDIERSKRCEQASRKRRSYKAAGYEEDGVYHDIYRADDLDDVKEESSKSPAQSRRSHREDEYESRRNNVKSRLGHMNSPSNERRNNSGHSGGDLRDKLRHRGDNNDKNKRERREKETVKEEEDTDLLNLCIEVKQEPQLNYDDVEMQEDFEF